MPYGDDISEGLPLTLSNPAGATYTPSGYAYDVAIAGLPFFISPLDDQPYRRVTAQYRKQQIDQSREPGEQTLTGWWLRSQSSFHFGQGIKFFEPIQDESLRFQYTESKGINIWEKGQATLLRKSTPIGFSPDGLASNGRSNQFFNTIEWTISGTKYEGILYVDNYIMAKVDETGTITNFQNLDPAVDDAIYAAANDGTYAYWVTNAISGGNKLTLRKKALNLNSTDAATQMFQENGIVVTNAVLEYTKERLVAAINNKIYEISPNATALPTAVYTHPDSSHVWTSITSSGAAIYVAGYSGVTSSIVKFTLSTAGVMPTLTSAITAAELPIGEIVQKIRYYLGYMLIGTNKGVRVADVAGAQDGSITYGPLLFESTQPVFDFAFRDKFAWCASGNSDGTSGLIRIDLGNQIGPLVFAYANDLSSNESAGQFPTTACDFLGDTNRLLWVNAANMQNTITFKQLTSNVATLTTGTAHGYSVGDIIFVSGVGSPFDGTPTITGYKTITVVPTDTTFSYAATGSDVSLTAVSPVGAVIKGGTGYIEEASELVESGYLRTGFIRYNTLEKKIFKQLQARVDTTNGALNMFSITSTGDEFSIGTFSQGDNVPEVNISYPNSSQEYLGFRFVLNRSSADSTKGPLFTGYQVKSLAAIPRQRLIQYPLMCYDHERDRFQNEVGSDGSAYERISQIEGIENIGDTIRIEDFRTGESYIGLIEEMDFINRTPPSTQFSGFGGVLLVTIRSVT
jgi:hypothetical protein